MDFTKNSILFLKERKREVHSDMERNNQLESEAYINFVKKIDEQIKYYELYLDFMQTKPVLNFWYYHIENSL
jgi:hypothetical protein